jgi:hypothetical protein
MNLVPFRARLDRPNREAAYELYVCGDTHTVGAFCFPCQSLVCTRTRVHLEFVTEVGRLPSGGDGKAPAEGSGPTIVATNSGSTPQAPSLHPRRDPAELRESDAPEVDEGLAELIQLTRPATSMSAFEGCTTRFASKPETQILHLGVHPLP